MAKLPLSHMVCDLEIKSQDERSRTFEGALSTSHVDFGDGFERDIVHPGAFKRSLSFFKQENGRQYVPLLDSHNMQSILNVYGHMLDGEEMLTGKTLHYETADGVAFDVQEMKLNTQWQVIDGADGERVLDRMRPGSVRKMSMGYLPFQKDYVNLKGVGRVRNLRQVGLREGSLVVFGMNDNAEVDRATVKALADLDSMTDEEKRALIESMPDAQKAELRALLAPAPEPATALAPEALVQSIQTRVLRLKAHQLATRIARLRGSAPGDLTITEVSNRGEQDRGAA